MSNKEALQLIKGVEKEYKVFYEKGDLKAINLKNKEVLEELDKLDKIPKNKANNLNKFELTHSLGNSKIGEDTICISVSCGLLCPMSLLGECSNCLICYAKNQNKMYFKNTVAKNLINQNIINSVVLGEVSLHNVLFELVNSIYCNYSKKQVANLKFLRFNVEGDILNNDILGVLDKIAKCLIVVFNLESAYTYTHNKNLNFKSVNNLVFNTSDFKVKGVKSCKTIDFVEVFNYFEEIIKGEVILCNGNCLNCPYCKDKEDKRDILFIKHGGEFKGVEELGDYIIRYLEAKKEVDYMKFILRNNNKGVGLNE